MLLRTYGQRGMLHIAKGQPHLCASCNDKGCVSATNEQQRSCPNGLDPRILKDSSNCTFCGQCVKFCSNQNIAPLIRKMPSIPSGKQEDFAFEVTIFAFFLSGFVIEEMFHEWHLGEYYYSFLPDAFKRLIHIKPFFGFVDGIWSMVVVPLMLWLLIGLIGKALNLATTIKKIWFRISLPLITILIGAQLVRAFSKFSDWITHLTSAFEGFIQRIILHPLPIFSTVGFSMPETSEGLYARHFFSNNTILIFSLMVLTLFSWFAIKEAKNISEDGNKYSYMIAILAVLNMVVVIMPRFQ